ncbi:hypothetical protein [Sneathiella glossodoripedis]|uniref:hypothetical protein n=1 Tax=Sneathiella glossodoripedis TaxID=418853 RepID=UPI00131F2CF6|nr:hypothetical protein [Sneathiella glossodoripedis]
MQEVKVETTEPDIEDLLADPVLLLLLDRDGVSVDELRTIVAQYREKQEQQPVSIN